MTMTGNEPPADAQRRLAEFELAELGGDSVARNAAIAAIQKSPGGAVAGFIAAATCHLNLLVTVAGEDRACETLRMAALDASLHKGVRRMTEPRQHIFYTSKNVGWCGTSSFSSVGRWGDRDGRVPLMNLQKCRQSADRL